MLRTHRFFYILFARLTTKDMSFDTSDNHSVRHQIEDRIRDAQGPGYQWPAGRARAYTGREKVCKQDAGAVEVEGSKSAYGRGHGPASMLAYLSTLALDAVKLPPPYETWLSMRDQ
jgi:hypothetical protein